MKKRISFTSVAMLLQFTDFIFNKLKDYNLENRFKIQSNNNTLQVEKTTMR